MSELGNIKGVAFGEFLGWYAKRYGRLPVEDAVRVVESRHRAGLSVSGATFGVLSSQWYPASVVHELVDRLTGERSPKELDEMARDAAGFIMGRTLRGVYRTMFSLFATPARYVRYVDKLWDTHYDTGKVVFRIPAAGIHHATYVDWASHHPFICRMNMASSLTIYDAMGCENVRYERKRCVSDGAADCENVVRWDAAGVRTNTK